MPDESTLPFRWSPERDPVGSLLDDVPAPDLWFLDALLIAAAQTIARCADGDVYFLGRSCDSMYDLLGGLLAHTQYAQRLHLLPGSLGYTLTSVQRTQLRVNMEAAGVSPQRIAARTRPLAVADIVHTGTTYGSLVGELHRWAQDTDVAWDAVRNKLRLIGLTLRTHTSPNTHRWHQHAEWAALLPRTAIVNVSVPRELYFYLVNDQPKTSSAFTPSWWIYDRMDPQRGAYARTALAEARAVYAAGCTKDQRAAFAAALAREHCFREPWLRTLALRVRGR